MFDSGDYSIKSKMHTMHDDMGGAAAVIGAIRAIALMELEADVVAVIPACKNMISGNAFVPGDVLRTKAGRTIEVLSTDAEGRLILADALTYAIHEEKADEIVDIATLTGAAKRAVGNKCAAVMANHEELYGLLEKASLRSCEKIWRLDLDGELGPALSSSVADFKSSNPDNPAGGGAILAGLFLQKFVEKKPWAHIDMAPVNWLTEENAYCRKGATGYGVSLLYQFVKFGTAR
jgi:leucyl aminopeptidase